jgi:hypothetical protein
MAGHRDHHERVKMRVKDRERLRAIIDVEKLIKRLQAFALARAEDFATDPALAMVGDQLTATRMLLNKVLPDLASVEIAPDADAVAILPVPITPEQWAATHAGPQDGETVQ